MSADRISEMATDLRTQLSEKSKDFIAHSLSDQYDGLCTPGHINPWNGLRFVCY